MMQRRGVSGRLGQSPNKVLTCKSQFMSPTCLSGTPANYMVIYNIYMNRSKQACIAIRLTLCAYVYTYIYIQLYIYTYIYI